MFSNIVFITICAASDSGGMEVTMDYKKYYKKSTVKADNDNKKQTKIETRDSLEASKEQEGIDKIIYISLLVALLIIPIFIKAHIAEFISPHLTFMSTGMQADVYSYYKYVFLILLTILMSILFLYKVLFLNYEIRKSKINLFLAIFAIAITLSAIYSPYKSLALQGMFNRHEGTITYICYLILFFVAANTRFSVKQVYGFLYTLYPFVFINMLLGLSLFNGKDALQIDWIQNFIMASVPEGAQISEGGKFWATVSNPNYISGIGSVIAILFLTWAIFDRNKVRTVLNIAVAAMSFTMVLTSFSTSGFLTILVMIPIVLFLILMNANKVKSFIVLAVFVILASSIYVPLADKNPRVWTESFGFIIKENPFVKPPLSDGTGTGTVSHLSKKINETMNFKSNYHLKSSRSAENNTDAFVNHLFNPFLPGKAFAEAKSEAETMKYEIPTLPESSQSAGSGRAYIWEKTFETAMKRPILGYGLDTFPYVFPQNDIDKIAGLWTYNIVVDKPHNMYLGLLIGSGVIALLAFVLLVGSILSKCINAIWKRRNLQTENGVILSLFTASTAFMVQGLVNDSVVGSAVIFWILLGVLVSIMNRTEVE